MCVCVGGTLLLSPLDGCFRVCVCLCVCLIDSSVLPMSKAVGEGGSRGGHAGTAKGAADAVIPPFQFRRRTQRLNWMQITDTDVDLIERTVC